MIRLCLGLNAMRAMLRMHSLAAHRKMQHSIMKRGRPGTLLEGILYDMECLSLRYGTKHKQQRFIRLGRDDDDDEWWYSSARG